MSMPVALGRSTNSYAESPNHWSGPSVVDALVALVAGAEQRGQDLNLRPPGYEQGEPSPIPPDTSPTCPFVALATATSHPSQRCCSVPCVLVTDLVTVLRKVPIPVVAALIRGYSANGLRSTLDGELLMATDIFAAEIVVCESDLTQGRKSVTRTSVRYPDVVTERPRIALRQPRSLQPEQLG